MKYLFEIHLEAGIGKDIVYGEAHTAEEACERAVKIGQPQFTEKVEVVFLRKIGRVQFE